MADTSSFSGRGRYEGMPIPHIDVEIPLLRNQRPALRLVTTPVDSQARTSPLWYPRALAHFIDLGVITGLSVYVTKLCALFVLAFQMGAIRAAGKAANSVFLQSFAYAQAMLVFAVTTLVIVVLQIALPAATGRTLGLGALGLRLEENDGRLPSVRGLALRLAGCGFGYLSGGLMTLLALRGLEGSFLQDRLSRTRVVESGKEGSAR